MLPSEYFKRQCYIALDVDEEPAVDVVNKMGADYFVSSLNLLITGGGCVRSRSLHRRLLRRGA
jgi:hypothetical protein